MCDCQLRSHFDDHDLELIAIGDDEVAKLQRDEERAGWGACGVTDYGCQAFVGMDLRRSGVPHQLVASRAA